MIIFGTKSTHLTTQNISGQCKNCGTSNSLQLSAFQKYVHVFWIPTFPAGREYVTQCSHCRNELVNGGEIRFASKTAYDEIKYHLKTPLWIYTGVALIAVLVMYSIIEEYKKDENNKVFIQSPTKGDVYKVKTEEGQYSLLKVSRVNGDTIIVFQNNYVATQARSLTELIAQGDSTYSTESYPILKDDIVKMFEKKDIIDVVRE
ncbi:hypothetical protein ACFQ21_27455 [Ohtaekwangia kribbensis]|jgi:hypothetical protein|uniref:Zinc-ribbon 15 domain-containing protein n=1 Tax=Ohtaekwangia kribbensis TaxID=688913 RepID=A0ABW3KCM3_9BACT